MNGLIKYNHTELTRLLDSLQQSKISLELKLVSITEKINFIKKVIEKNDGGEKNWIIYLPEGIIEELGVTEKVKKTKTNRIQWKKIALDILKKYNYPMSSELIYHKTKQIYHDLPKDHKLIVKNISSALVYLHSKGVLFRQKLEGGKEYVYGFINHFDEKGNIKDDFLKTYKLEREGQIK